MVMTLWLLRIFCPAEQLCTSQERSSHMVLVRYFVKYKDIIHTSMVTFLSDILPNIRPYNYVCWTLQTWWQKESINLSDNFEVLEVHNNKFYIQVHHLVLYYSWKLWCLLVGSLQDFFHLHKQANIRKSYLNKFPETWTLFSILSPTLVHKNVTEGSPEAEHWTSTVSPTRITSWLASIRRARLETPNNNAILTWETSKLLDYKW